MSNGKPDPASSLEAALALHGRSRWRRWLFWIVLLALVAGTAFALMRRNGKQQQATVQYKTQEATRGNLVVTVTATGNLEPINQVEVGSEQSGIVKVVNVDYNDTVKVGQVLAQLDTTKIKAQIEQARATLASAKAQVLSAQATVTESRNELGRLNELRKISTSKAVSQHDLDTAQAALDRAIASEEQAEALVKQNEAALSADETDLSKMTIVSPINGVVLTRSIDPGQTVAASFETPKLFVLAEDLAKMQLNVGVDEADIGMVKAGQEATFTVDAFSDRKFPATIRRVNYGSTATDNVVTYETVLDVDNANLELRPGMTATATITVKKVENAILVPNAALRFAPPEEKKTDTSASGGSLLSKILPHPPRQPAKAKTEKTNTKAQPVVWTLKEGQLAAIPVTTGATDGSMTETLSGEVQPGTELVTDTIKAAK